MRLMKRLFVLRYGKGGALVQGEDGIPLYFDNKMDAKRIRDERNKTDGRVVVSYGPDHDKYQHGGK